MEEKKFRFGDLSTDLKAHMVDKVRRGATSTSLSYIHN